MDPIRKAFLEDYKKDSMFEIVQILDKANDFGLTTEVVHTALKTMKEHPDMSPLLCLQIAAKDWDL